jgi:methyl-accepting chemotaxis protein
VEAARAGEQGRGFAVVAAEVRCAGAAQRQCRARDQGPDRQSVEQVEAGSGVVRRAGDTMTEIVQSSSRVDTLLGDVATGAREQAAASARSARPCRSSTG